MPGPGPDKKGGGSGRVRKQRKKNKRKRRENQAREIIVAHLDFYRINTADYGTVKPFTEDGIDVLLRKLHPRDLLASAANVFRYAVQEKIVTIDAKTVNAAMDSSVTESVPDFTEAIDGAL